MKNEVCDIKWLKINNISANVFPDGKDGKPINDFIEVPDNQTQGKMVELGYKIKGKLDSSSTGVKFENKNMKITFVHHEG